MPFLSCDAAATVEAGRASPAYLIRAAAAEAQQDGSAPEAPLAAAGDHPAEVLAVAEQVRSATAGPAGCEAPNDSSRADFVGAHSVADEPVLVAARCLAPHSGAHSLPVERMDDCLLDFQQDDCSAPADSSQDGCLVVPLLGDHYAPEAGMADSIPVRLACWVQADLQQAVLVPDDCSPAASDDHFAPEAQPGDFQVDSPDAHSLAAAGQGVPGCSMRASHPDDFQADLRWVVALRAELAPQHAHEAQLRRQRPQEPS